MSVLPLTVHWQLAYFIETCYALRVPVTGVSRMTRELKVINISNVPELLHLAEEVRNTNEPCVLRRDSEDLAILMPPARARKRRALRAKTKADYEAFRSAAGSWKDMDTDKFVADIYESRRRSSRPPVEL